MAGRRIATYGGLASVGIGAYYLYNAGGDPKIAEKQFEHDAAAASRKLKGELPGREKEAKKAGEESYESVKSAASDFVTEANKAEAKFEQYSKDAGKKLQDVRQETGKQLNSAVDKFDQTVTEGASKSKSWIGSWFGGK
ncbi:hypothetical protein CC78DRAFT_456419 [Lojkania enalia]|uniref:Calcofluor white hypersensitive protein n=1 Tax=Lojkania enalia TaxID=147567 RepID=A0A9P4KHB8_9PLEO|nr:hypothetical protein CC78DRAFT_456419 [Didymosphaeria enalia]